MKNSEFVSRFPIEAPGDRLEMLTPAARFLLSSCVRIRGLIARLGDAPDPSLLGAIVLIAQKEKRRQIAQKLVPATGSWHFEHTNLLALSADLQVSTERLLGREDHIRAVLGSISDICSVQLATIAASKL